MSSKTRQYVENINKPGLKGNKRSKSILQSTEKNHSETGQAGREDQESNVKSNVLRVNFSGNAIIPTIRGGKKKKKKKVVNHIAQR